MWGRWWAFGLVSLMVFVPVMGWSQESSHTDRTADLEPSVENQNAPLRLPRTGGGSDKSGKRTDKPLTRQSSWTTAGGSLIIVIALIVGCGYLLRHHKGAGNTILADDVIQLLGRKPLDQRTTLQLVRCGSKVLVLSNSIQHGVRLVSELVDPLEVEALTAQCLRGLEPNPSMGLGLFRKLGHTHGVPASPNHKHSPLTTDPNGPRVSSHGGGSHA